MPRRKFMQPRTVRPCAEQPQSKHAAIAKRLEEEQARNRAAQRVFHKNGRPINRRP